MGQLVWLVTGCSSGFGEHFVQDILKRGDKIIATARNAEKLASLEELGAATLQLDITDNQQSIRETIAKAIGIYGTIDVLVNNAAFISIGTWEDLEYVSPNRPNIQTLRRDRHEDWLAEFDTNVFGTIKVTRALLPHFRKRRSGTNVFMGSLSGWVGHPGCSNYAGTKFALEGIVEGLWRETSHLGIKTLLIEPGRFRTNLLSGSKMHAVQTKIPDYRDLSNGLLSHLAKEDNSQPRDPAKLVSIIVDLVHGEGVTQGREMPFRLPLGTDCFDEIKSKCEETLKMLNEWETVSRSTDFA